MEGENSSICRAHALVFPYPAQGHINPMLEFSKRLVSKGISATVTTTKYIIKSMHTEPSSQINVEAISDGFDEGGYLQAESGEIYLSSLEVVGSRTLSELIKKFADSSHPFTVLIYDGFLPWALDIAKQFGLRGVAFFTQSCAVNNIYYHVHQGLLPLPEKGSTVSLPGLPVLEVSDTPSFISDFGSYPNWYHTVVNQFKNIDEADWILYNNFYHLEKEVVDWMAERWRLGTIGPTVPSMYLDRRLEGNKEYGINLFQPKTSTCINWLQDKSSGSVVYVSFGSAAVLGEEQMAEVAWGLKQSNCYFLWVVRATEEAKLPNNFIEETSNKGLVVTWCPQLPVLAHEAVGCFLTHCGFNSVMEALSLGVPLVAMPQWTDQPTNAKYIEDFWKVGIRTRPDEKGIVRRDNVELCVREVLEGEKGKEMKESAIKWKKLAKEAVDEGGTSDRNMDEFVAKLLCS